MTVILLLWQLLFRIRCPPTLPPKLLPLLPIVLNGFIWCAGTWQQFSQHPMSHKQKEKNRVWVSRSFTTTTLSLSLSLSLSLILVDWSCNVIQEGELLFWYEGSVPVHHLTGSHSKSLLQISLGEELGVDEVGHHLGHVPRLTNTTEVTRGHKERGH